MKAVQHHSRDSQISQTTISQNGTANARSSIALLASFAIRSASAVDTKTLFRIDAGIELENVAVRAYGNILATSVSQPVLSLFQFDPPSHELVPASIRIPGAASLLGIAEYSPDVFAVAAGNWTQGSILVPSTFSTWSMDFRPAEPAVSKIVVLPQAA